MDDQKINKEISEWGKDTKDLLVRQFKVLSIEHVERSPSPEASEEALRHILGRKQGLISKVTFRFPRHMVFVQKGVGKGTPIKRAGSGKRKAKDWFNGPMDGAVEVLADKVAGSQADMIVNSIKIK